MTAQGHRDGCPGPTSGARADTGHGTRFGYRTGRCRCACCRAAQARYAATLKKEVRQAGSRLVGTGPARDVLRRLRDLGLEPAAVTAATGIASSTQARLLMGTQRTVQRRTLDLLLFALGNARPSTGTRMPAAGTVRRVEALLAHGWPLKEIAARLGVAPRTVTELRGRTRVTFGTARRVAAVYAVLSPRAGAGSCSGHGVSA